MRAMLFLLHAAATTQKAGDVIASAW